MDINAENNIINKVSAIRKDELSQLDLSLYLIRRQKHSENYYESSGVVLGPEVTAWLKERIVESLNELKVIDENREGIFNVSNYNHEIERQDHIARYDLDRDESLLNKKNKLVKSLRESSSEYTDQTTNFQIVKLRIDETDIYFCFYRGTKKNTKRKKMAIKNSNEFNFINETVIDIGGNIDFFFIDNQLFIINNRSFEHAFSYRDHVNQKRDEVLVQITSMPFFDHDESNGELFSEKCKTYIYSRSLAQITNETLISLQRNFDARCSELKEIKQGLPENQEEQNEYIEKLGSIWLLLEYIDVENNKIIYKEESNPTPLIHFFADKIVRSFLTEDIKLALAYEYS